MLYDIMPTNLNKKRHVYIPDDLWQLVENVAKRHRISKSEAIRLILKTTTNGNGSQI